MLIKRKVLPAFVCFTFHESEHQVEKRLSTALEGIVDGTNEVKLGRRKFRTNIKFPMKVRYITLYNNLLRETVKAQIS